jgi:hypothetical protein
LNQSLSPNGPHIASTQTADFSEAEESTDSDGNDDRISWKEVSRRGMKKKNTRTKNCQHKENKLQETNNHPTQLTIANKPESLRHAETVGNIKQRKDTAQSPKFVPEIKNMQRLTATIELVVNRSN